MNIFTSLCVAVCFAVLGVSRILNIKKCTLTLCEAVKFINSVKNNIRFSSMDYENLINEGKKEGFLYINFNGGVTLSDYAGEKAKHEFSCFVNKIGTTDEEGQISLCEEYAEKFKVFYKESVSVEKSKVRVIGALSVLSVICVLILGG